MMKSSLRPVAASLDRRAERLVVYGMRGWMAGYDTGDVACWEAVWNDYCRELGPTHAKSVVSELAGWIRVMRAEACRSIACYPRPCRFMCRDECLALRLVSGCQMGRRPVACESACQLVACSRVDGLIEATECYAGELARAGLELQPVSEEVLAAFSERPAPDDLN
jgi:hypothetical protein